MSAGDVLFTFEAVGYTWAAKDARNPAEVGDLYREIAWIYPVAPGGAPLESITVKGATRRNVVLTARWAGTTVQAWERNSYGEGLTEKTARAVSDAAVAAFAAHPVPELAGDELAERASETLAARARHAAWEAFRESAFYNVQTLDAATPAQRADALERATAGFRAELADRLRVTL